MANSSKCKCKECKRTISITDQFCPYCSSPNPYAGTQVNPAKAVQKASMADDLEDFLNQENIAESDINEKDILEDDDFCVNDEFEETEQRVNISGYGDMTEEESFHSDIDDTDEYVNFKENYGGSNQDLSDQINQAQNIKGNRNNNVQSIRNMTDGRTPIDWTDETPVAPPDYSNMYNENGVYNPNYDGFYNDTLPKIQDEIDNLIAGREKTILKIVFGFVAIIGIIIYLILTI